MLPLSLYAQFPGGVTSGLNLWLKADGSLNTYSGNNVITARDYSGLNMHASGSGTIKPQIINNQYNFNPTFRFDGSTSYFDLPDGFSNFTAGMSFFGMANFTNTNSYARLIDFGNGQQNNNLAFNRYSTTDMIVLVFYYGASVYRQNLSSSGAIENYSLFNYSFTSSAGSPGASTNSTIFKNGQSLNSMTNFIVPANVTRSLNFIGKSNWSADPIFQGDIPEMIIYNTLLSATDKQKIDSYLAIKYGHLLNNGNSNYLATDGSIIWNATTNINYANGVFGIGRDDNQALDQRVAKAINYNDILTITLDNNFTAANNDITRTTIHANDRQYLILSNNNGATTLNQTTELPAVLSSFNITKRMAREWRVSKTANFTQGVYLKFNGITVLSNENIYAVKIANTAAGDFTNSSAQSLGLIDNQGILKTSVVLNDGDYITLMVGSKAPGGVVTGLQHWLKADNPNLPSPITHWPDSSINARDIKEQGTGTPALVTNSLNFNPVISLDGTTSFYKSYPANVVLNFTVGYTAGEAIAVGKTNITNAFNSHMYMYGGEGNYSMYPASNGQYFDTFFTNDRYGFDASNTAISSSDSKTGMSTRAFTFVPTNYNIYSTFSKTNEWGININGRLLTATTTNTVATNFYTLYGNAGVCIGAADSLLSFNGQIGEVILYNKVLTTPERERIYTYLSVKYGMTFNNGDSAYRDALGNEIRTVDSTFKHDIFGLGRDDKSDLNQKISKPLDSDDILTIALDNNFTLSNENAARTTTHLQDSQYLFFSNNDGAITPNATSDLPLDLFGGMVTKRTARVWKVAKTANFNNTVYIQLTGTVFKTPNTYHLIESNTPNFATGSIYKATFNADGIASTNSLQNGKYYTIVEKITAPGGITSNLNLWIKADQSVTTSGNNITAITDVSPKNLYATKQGASFPLYTANALNFNPSITFDGNSYFTLASGINDFTLGATAYTVFNKNDIASSSEGKLFDFSTGATNHAFIWKKDGTTDDLKVETRNATGTIIGFGTTTTSPLSPSSDFSLYGFDLQVGTSGQTGRTFNSFMNGKSIFNNTSHATPLTVARTQNYIFGNPSNESIKGSIPELIIYNDLNTSIEKQKIDTYLAIKYGITLDQSSPSASSNYIDTDGTVIWPSVAYANYKNRIFGIGRDEIEDLKQYVSKSSHTTNGSILTISTTSNATAENLGRTQMENNKSYFLVGDNGSNDTVFTKVGGAFGFYIIPRIWKSKGSNLSATQPIFLTFNVNDTFYNIPETGNYKKYNLGSKLLEEYYLVIDNDANDSFTNDIPVVLTRIDASTYQYSGLAASIKDKKFTIGFRYNTRSVIINSR